MKIFLCAKIKKKSHQNVFLFQMVFRFKEIFDKILLRKWKQKSLETDKKIANFWQILFFFF